MPKTKEQNELIKQERYEAILIACLHLFAFEGYGVVTVDQITQKAKISHGLFYHYFKNIDEAFIALMKKLIDSEEKWLSPIDLEGQSAIFSLRELVNKITTGLKSKDDHFACSIYLMLNLFFKQGIPRPDKPKKTISPLRRRPLYEIVKYIVDKGQIEGTFLENNSQELTIALLSLIKGLAYNRCEIGAKRFICPNDKIICHTILKEA